MSRELTREDWTAIRAAEGRKSLDVDGRPAIFLGYQSGLMDSVSRYAVTVVEKSRRTGVTWGAAAIAVLTSAAARSDGGMDTLYIGYNLDMAREFIDTAAEWARRFESAIVGVIEETLFDDGPDKSIKAFRIAFASGFEILALSSKPRSLRGRQGFVVIDEAAFHDDLPGLLQAALALLIWGGKVLIISTHYGDANPFNGLVQDIRSGRRPYNLMRVDFDEALRDGLYERVCDTKGQQWTAEGEAAWRDEIRSQYGEAADEELYCIPSAGSGLWLTTPLIEARMQGDPSTVVRLERPSSFAHLPAEFRQAEIRDWCERELRPLLEDLDPTLCHVFGEDFGRVSDLTVIWPLEIRKDLTRRTPFVVELRNVPFEQQRDVLFYVVDRLPRMIAGKLDATGNGAYLAEVAAQRYGEHRIEQVKLSTEWYRETMPRVKRHFEEGTIILPRDADIREDLRLVRVASGVAQVPPVRQKAADGKTRHADAAVAIALAVAASEADPVEYDYRPVPAYGEARRRDPFALPTPDERERELRSGLHFRMRGGL